MVWSGYGRHNSPDGVRKEIERMNWLQRAGWRVYQCTNDEAKMPTSPERVIVDVETDLKGE